MPSSPTKGHLRRTFDLTGCNGSEVLGRGRRWPRKADPSSDRKRTEAVSESLYRSTVACTTDDLLLGELFVAEGVRPLMDGVEFRRKDFGEVVLDLDDVN